MLETKIIAVPLGRGRIRHAYLMLIPEEGILVDPGGFGTAGMLREAIEVHTPIEHIRSVILQCTHCSNTAALHYLKEHGLDATIYHNSDEALDLTHSFESHHIRDVDFEVSLKNGESITFIPAPFLPYPDAFMTFLSGRNALFSSSIFSQTEMNHESREALKASLRAFHEKHMPSSEFLRPVLKQLDSHPIRSIYPATGSPIRWDDVKPVLTYLSKLDFYNTDLVKISTRTNKKRYNYPMILNHMLKRLEAYYDPVEIMDVFKDSPITIEHNLSLEVTGSPLGGYKLWNRFFDDIYRKKGLEWLALMEPVMRKYTRLYGIRQPAIYKSELVRGKLKVRTLSEEKSDLETRVETLNKTLEKTAEQLVRCPLTGLYNARFFRKHLQNELYGPQEEGRGFLTIRVDAFRDLNRKHGKASGDETLQNAAYLIERMKPEEALLFRGEGPGFHVFFNDTTEETMRQDAVRIRNGIGDSSLFIESISVSIAIVGEWEVKETDPALRTHKLIELSNRRLEVAQSRGGGQIIDSSDDASTITEGTLLLVDEDETMHNLMVQIFARVQYEVHIAGDIYAAYEYIQKTKVDAIISEINLSKLDGLQFKRWLNDSQSYRDIPFIIMSHHKTRDVIKRANALDVALVLKKPIIPEELVGHVKRMRESRRGQ